MPRAGAGEEEEHPTNGDSRQRGHDRGRVREEPKGDPRVVHVVDGERPRDVDLLVQSKAGRREILRHLVGAEGRQRNRAQGNPLGGGSGE